MAKKRRPEIFSVTKAVKANARVRLGTPPPSTPIPHRQAKMESGPAKHKQQLQNLLAAAEQEL